jgi:hypothetical protein
MNYYPNTTLRKMSLNVVNVRTRLVFLQQMKKKNINYFDRILVVMFNMHICLAIFYTLMSKIYVNGTNINVVVTTLVAMQKLCCGVVTQRISLSKLNIKY